MLDLLAASKATKKKTASRDNEEEEVGEVGKRTVHHGGEH